MLLKPALLPLLTLALANPIHRQLHPRDETILNQEAFDEAQQRDDTATRAITNSQLKTSDGQCVFVNLLSGDFRANLLPLQVGTCGSSNGEGWDVITKGVHNDQTGQALVVSTLSNGCVSFDPRRTSNQVHVFSCGGRADGSGQTSNSQLFAFNGTSNGLITLSLEPDNQAGSCLTVSGNSVGIASCKSGDLSQQFTFTGTAPISSTSTAVTSTPALVTSSVVDNFLDASSTCAPPNTVTITNTVTTTVPETTSSPPSSTSEALNTSNIPTTNPTTPIPVSRAGGTLNPTAIAESHEKDTTATREFTSASIHTPDGQCLFIDPTAGDFRENLIPVQYTACSGSPNEKFDFITAGKHNDQPGNMLVVSSLTNGCIGFDGRRAQGDQVIVFSCGGRAAGEGLTDSAQLVPYTGGASFVWAPVGAKNETCLVAGDAGRLNGAACDGSADQVFTIVQ